MFGKSKLNKRAAQEVITELLLECESAIEYGEVLGAVKMAFELGMISKEEKEAYEKTAYEKHYTFSQQKEAERKSKAAEYNAAKKKKKKEKGL